MDLCIGILVHKIDPTPLVTSLVRQIQKIDFEAYILIHDDGSPHDYQETIRSKWFTNPRVKLSLETTNEGRAKARNKILRSSVADYLLMIDGDAIIQSEDFLKCYWDHRQEEAIVVGSKTLSTPKAVPGAELRWFYAREREIKTVPERKFKAYLSFQTNSFLIDIKNIDNLYFDENLKGYGHEDSLFGLRSQEEGYIIKHINNPTHYRADEQTATFLKKTDEALLNLLYIESVYEHYSELFPLLAMKRRLKDWRLDSLFLGFWKVWMKLLLSNLKSNNPSMRVFDLYRLIRLFELERSNKII